MMSFLWVGYTSRVHRYSYFDPSIEYSNAGGDGNDFTERRWLRGRGEAVAHLLYFSFGPMRNPLRLRLRRNT